MRSLSPSSSSFWRAIFSARTPSTSRTLYPAFSTAFLRTDLEAIRESYSTTAFPRAKLTLASTTPGTSLSASPTVVEHVAQCIPPMVREISSLATSYPAPLTAFHDVLHGDLDGS